MHFAATKSNGRALNSVAATTKGGVMNTAPEMPPLGDADLAHVSPNARGVPPATEGLVCLTVTLGLRWDSRKLVLHGDCWVYFRFGIFNAGGKQYSRMVHSGFPCRGVGDTAEEEPSYR